MPEPGVGRPRWVRSEQQPDVEVWFDGNRNTSLTRRIDATTDVASVVPPPIDPLPAPGTVLAVDAPDDDAEIDRVLADPIAGGSMGAEAAKRPERRRTSLLAAGAVAALLLLGAGAWFLLGADDASDLATDRTGDRRSSETSKRPQSSATDRPQDVASASVDSPDASVRPLETTRIVESVGTPAGQTGKAPPLTGIPIVARQQWEPVVLNYIAADNASDAEAVADQYAYPLQYGPKVLTRAELIADLKAGWAAGSHSLAVRGSVDLLEPQVAATSYMELSVTYVLQTSWRNTDQSTADANGCELYRAVDKIRVLTGAPKIFDHRTEHIGPC